MASIHFPTIKKLKLILFSKIFAKSANPYFWPQRAPCPLRYTWRPRRRRWPPRPCRCPGPWGTRRRSLTRSRPKTGRRRSPLEKGLSCILKIESFPWNSIPLGLLKSLIINLIKNVIFYTSDYFSWFFHNWFYKVASSALLSRWPWRSTIKGLKIHENLNYVYIAVIWIIKRNSSGTLEGISRSSWAAAVFFWD